MAKVHAGMAKHGMAWFAREQTAGKGQPGKNWESQTGQNIALSIVIKPAAVYFRNQFYFNAAVSNACYNFFKNHAGEESSVKWPNDIYWRDRKAGGILIENKIMGKNWKWSVLGIGININQTRFSTKIGHAVSLKQITGKTYDPVILAFELYESIMAEINKVNISHLPGILEQYNEHLFKAGREVQLIKGKSTFKTKITGVNEYGQLMTQDTETRIFNFGEVGWVI